MWKPGDGSQKLEFFTRNVENVIRELLADIRLAGNQHFEYKEYRNAAGKRIFACDANGSVTFQIAQIHAGDGVVPVSLVLYIDGTFMKNGIPIRPIYRKFMSSTSYSMSKYYYDLVVDITIFSVMSCNCLVFLYSGMPEQQ